jgi:hypothetical protein
MASFLITKAQDVLDVPICWEDYADSFEMNKAFSWSTTRHMGSLSQVPHIQISLRISFDLQSDQSYVDFWLEVSFCNMTMFSPILPCNSCNNSRLAL